MTEQWRLFAREARRYGAPDGDYGDLWQWSVDNPARFWRAVWEYFDVARLRARRGRCRHPCRRVHAWGAMVSGCRTELRRPGSATPRTRTARRSSASTSRAPAPKSAGTNFRAGSGRSRPSCVASASRKVTPSPPTCPTWPTRWSCSWPPHRSARSGRRAGRTTPLRVPRRDSPSFTRRCCSAPTATSTTAAGSTSGHTRPSCLVGWTTRR